MLINAHHTPPTHELAQGAHKIVPYIEVEMFLGFYFHKKGINLQLTMKLLVVSANFLHCVGVGISQGVGLFQLPTHKNLTSPVILSTVFLSNNLRQIIWKGSEGCLYLFGYLEIALPHMLIEFYHLTPTVQNSNF